jgi:hypothetical protein
MEPTVWRLHIKQEPHVLVDDRCGFCIQDRAAGIGWQTSPNEAVDWAEYCKRQGTVNDNVRRLHDVVRCDDLIWTRNAKARYWIGRILGEWEYRCGSGQVEANIHNVRPCEWHVVGDLVQVPGTVRNAFIRGKTLQAIRNPTIQRYSMDLYNRLVDRSFYTLPDTPTDLFSLFDPDDCEDLVGVYLQLQGWVLYPGTCKTDTQQFEFALRHRRTGRMAAVQAKQGDEEIRISDYEDFDGDVFLFQTNGIYRGQRTKVTTILLDPGDMKRFCIENVALMPKTIQRWVEWCVGRP